MAQNYLDMLDIRDPEDATPKSSSPTNKLQELGIEDSNAALPEKPESWGTAILNAIPGMSPAVTGLAMNPKTIPQAAVTALKSIPNAAGQVVSGGMSGIGIPNFISDPLQNIPTPSPEASNAMAFAANTALAVPGIEAIPDIATLASSMGKKGFDTLQQTLGIAAKQKANSFMDDLLQGNSVSKSHLPVLDELRKDYKNNVSASAQQYEPIKDEAFNRGYVGGNVNPATGISPKGIKPNDFQNKLSSIDLDQYPKDVKDLLNPFVNKVNTSLSFNDAHKLQSEIGKHGAQLQTSADSAERSLGGKLLNIRDTLKNDITSNFASNGDTDLANQYQDASNFFKNNVAPYRENSTIRKVVMGSGLKEINPSNIGNVLKKDDGAILPIANNLSDQSKNLLLANELKSSIQELPNKAGILTRLSKDPQKLIDAYGNLDNKGLAYLRTPESIAKIQSIMGDLSRQTKLKWAAGIGATLGAGDLAHRIL